MPDPAPTPALSSDTPLALARDSEVRELTKALAHGSEQAWAEFHDRYRRRLIGYLSRLWHGEADQLDDLLQETYLRSVRHMRVFENDDALWSWLTVLARSAVADRGRRRSRWGRFLQRWRLESELRSLPIDPAAFTEQLAPALAQLDEQARALIEGKYYRRQSIRSLAAEFQLTEKAVEGRLARSRKQLSKLIQKQSS
jgi:RNA polymerase sigma-70 factor (ECF subfamily)